MMLTAGMGVPEELHPAFCFCAKNKEHLSVFPSLQGPWCGLDLPELLLCYLAIYCCSEGHSSLEPKVLLSFCPELLCLGPHGAWKYGKDPFCWDQALWCARLAQMSTFVIGN